MADANTGFRRDIEGLRAVAIGLVLVYHAGLPFVRGGFIGVDVFFVLSGFLITGLLVREAEKTGRLHLGRFYARRAKRLLPAAMVVLAVSAIIVITLLPVSDRRIFGQDIVAAALYVVNWVFAGRAVDYAAQDVGASPVLHFWSLAVEEQFYIVWPLVLLAVLAIVRRRRSLLRPAMAVGLTAIVVPSLVWSIVLTGRQDSSAFFVTTTRLWELGIGGLLAVGAPLVAKLPRALAGALGLAGAAVIAFSAVVFRESGGWPGAAALVPVLGAAALVAAGMGTGPTLVSRALAWSPLVWLGGLSYSLYLWHWPALVAARSGYGLTGVKWGVVVVLLSAIPAWVVHKLVENPVRYSRRVSKSTATALLVGATCSLVGVVAGLTVVAAGPSSTLPSASVVDPALRPLGGGVLGNDPAISPAGWPQDSYAAIWPELSSSSGDVPSYDSAECISGPTESAAKACDFGDLDSPVHVMLIGDSKASQWADVIDVVGQVNGWRITMYSKSSCPFSDATRVRDEAEWRGCTEWNSEMREIVLDAHPAAVITSQGSRTAMLPEHADAPKEILDDAVAGLTSLWTDLTAAGIPVIALADNPRPPNGYDVITCLTENPDDATQCAFDRDEAVAASGYDAQSRAIAAVPEVVEVSLNDYLCPHEQCAPVIGNVVLWRPGSHLTNTYVMSVAGIAAERFRIAGEGLGVATPSR